MKILLLSLFTFFSAFNLSASDQQSLDCSHSLWNEVPKFEVIIPQAAFVQDPLIFGNEKVSSWVKLLLFLDQYRNQNHSQWRYIYFDLDQTLQFYFNGSLPGDLENLFKMFQGNQIQIQQANQRKKNVKIHSLKECLEQLIRLGYREFVYHSSYDALGSLRGILYRVIGSLYPIYRVGQGVVYANRNFLDMSFVQTTGFLYRLGWKTIDLRPKDLLIPGFDVHVSYESEGGFGFKSYSLYFKIVDSVAAD